MSYDAELLKLLRQASIEHSVLQLKLLHEYKERMNQLIGPAESSGILLPEKGDEKHRPHDRGGGTSMSDLVFEMTRTSVLAWEQWLRLSTKQLDYTVGMLRGGRREGEKCDDLELDAKAKAGTKVDLPFRIRNPYPFQTRVSFGTLSLCPPKDGKRLYPTHKVTRTDGAEGGDDFCLHSSEEGHFRLSVDVAKDWAPGTYEGDAPVLLERAVVGTLGVRIRVGEDKK